MVGYLKNLAEILLDKVTVCYGKHVALSEVSGRLAPGSLTAVVGPNGGGKTTFVRALMRQVPIRRGSIKFNPDLKVIPAYLPQKSSLDTTFPMTLKEVVGMGLCGEIGSFQSFSEDKQAQISHVIREVGLQGLENRFVTGLSGGQFQRMLFGRLMLQNKSIIILDEPFAGIDTKTQEQLVKLILNWHRAGKTIIVVLHELHMVRKYFPQTILVGRTVIGWGDTESVLTMENMETAFQNLLEV